MIILIDPEIKAIIIDDSCVCPMPFADDSEENCEKCKKKIKN